MHLEKQSSQKDGFMMDRSWGPGKALQVKAISFILWQQGLESYH